MYQIMVMVIGNDNVSNNGTGNGNAYQRLNNKFLDKLKLFRLWSIDLCLFSGTWVVMFICR